MFYSKYDVAIINKIMKSFGKFPQLEEKDHNGDENFIFDYLKNVTNWSDDIIRQVVEQINGKLVA